MPRPARPGRRSAERARGSGHAHSDLDLIVRPGVRERRYELYDLADDVGFAHGVELAPLVIEEPRFAESRSASKLPVIAAASSH
jgi:hypothetical protein